MAVEALKRAVSLNPFHWTSFEATCRLKDPIDIKETFFRVVAAKTPPPLSNSSEREIFSETSSRLHDVEMLPVDEVQFQLQPLPVLPLSPVKSGSAMKKTVTRTVDRISSTGKRFYLA